MDAERAFMLFDSIEHIKIDEEVDSASRAAMIDYENHNRMSGDV